MKHIFKYLGALLAVVLIGATFTACSEDDAESANVGLGIKTFFPTKVVTNQPITINGSGFDAITEIEFPGGAKVTNFEIVGNDMVRVNAPAGIAADGGKIVVRTANGEAESRQSLTLGHTNVTGFSKQPGEEAAGGELITVYGTDLEFINSVELLDPDSVFQLIDHKDFYRKGTSNLIFRVPKKDIYDGTFVGYLHTYDGQKIALPELTYKPAADEGHWETVRTSIWKNTGSDEVNWNGTYRFALEGHDGNNECIAEIPQEVWEKMKTETFFISFKPTADWYQIRITNGWWDTQWLGKDNDFSPNNMADQFIDNGDGTYSIQINFGDDPLVGTLDEKHLLFTGSGYIPLEIYFEEEVWVGGGGHMELIKTSFWKNGGSDEVNWNGTYRFALEGHDGNNECIAEIPQDIWDKIKTGPFFISFKPTADWYQIRITNGWWDTQWLGKDNDFSPNNMADQIIDNGDGTYSILINFGDDPLVGTLDEKHLLFTGSGYIPLELYFEEEVWVGGGDGGSSDIDIAAFTLYEDRSANLEWPYFPSWGDNSGKLRIMRGLGDKPIETLGLTTASKFIVYKEAGTTGQIQWNNPNWASFSGVDCSDWEGSAETLEVPVTEDMLKCISGEISDGWSDTAIILQGDGMKVTKIVIVP